MNIVIYKQSLNISDKQVQSYTPQMSLAVAQSYKLHTQPQVMAMDVLGPLPESERRTLMF